MERVSRVSIAHPRVTVALWTVILLVAAFGIWQGSGRFTSRIDGHVVGDPAALHVLDARGEPASSHLVCAVNGAEIGRDLTTLTTTSIDSVEAAAVSRSVGDCYLAKWNLGAPTGPDVIATPVSGVASAIPDLPLISSTSLTGWFGIGRAMSQVSDMDEAVRQAIVKAERLALPLAFVVLLVTLRGAVRAFVPLASGALSCVIAIGALSFWAQRGPVSIFVVSIVTMLGLALGIDYALFWMSRVKPASPGVRGDDVIATCRLACPTILAAGITVCAASLGLFAIPLRLFRDVVLGVGVASVTAMLIPATLLPAVAMLVPQRWLARAHRSGSGGSVVTRVWQRFAKSKRRAAIGASAALLFLLALAVAASGLRLGLSVGPVQLGGAIAGNDAYAQYAEEEATATRLALIDIGFVGDAVGRDTPVILAFLAQDSDFAPFVVIDRFPDQAFAVIRAVVVRPAGSPEAAAAIGRLEAQLDLTSAIPSSSGIAIGGALVTYTHVLSAIGRYQWFAAVISIVLVAATMTAFHRRPFLALLAVAGTMVSFLAALGVLVLVEQRGMGGWLGREPVPFIESWVPVVMFCVIAGMSIDYHLFVMGGISHARRQGMGPMRAVSAGVEVSAPIVASAATIMVLVFGGFVLGDVTEMRQLGIGLAAGIAIDAVIVRLFLVPMILTLFAPSGQSPRQVGTGTG